MNILLDWCRRIQQSLLETVAEFLGKNCQLVIGNGGFDRSLSLETCFINLMNQNSYLQHKVLRTLLRDNLYYLSHRSLQVLWKHRCRGSPLAFHGLVLQVCRLSLPRPSLSKENHRMNDDFVHFTMTVV